MEPRPDRANSLPLYVLIGGESRRFGQDKALHPVDGEPWAMHVARRLTLPGDPVVMVGKAPPSELLTEAFSVPDAPGVGGPLGGVMAALADREARWGPGLLGLASCDLVRPERAWLRPLLALILAQPDLDATAYRDAKGWQPFPSVLHTRWLDGLRELSDEGVRSLQTAFDRSRVIGEPWAHGPEGPAQANSLEALQALLGTGEA